MSRDFEEIVIGNFRDEYARARTPNPCIVCNPLIKFRTLLEAADSAGAYHIATGHYAGTFRDDETGTWYIKKAVNARKDQSYIDVYKRQRSHKRDGRHGHTDGHRKR